MLKTESLIALTNALTKAEKKAFKTNKKRSDYLDLFDMIDKNKGITAEELRTLFNSKKTDSSFDVTVGYLYKLLIDTLLSLRENNDNHYLLMNRILKARVLFEKSLFEESLNTLRQVQVLAKKQENNVAYIYAARLELEYLLFLNFPNISEAELLNKHFKINEELKIIRKVNEQSSLYELLRHRIIHKGNSRSQQQKDSLNDLVISEMSIVSSLREDNFEINKLHQLFQSNYLISVGDYKSALHSYYELNRLFEANRHLMANPPRYYLMVIEGILDNLRSIKDYHSIPYFIEQLKKLNHSSTNFQMEVSCIIFLYTFLPYLDRGEFNMAKALLLQDDENILDKLHLLSPSRQAEVCLYRSLIHLGLKEYKQAKKSLNRIINHSKSFYSLPLYRTIRLINLIIYYETGDYDSIEYETRSIKRGLSKTEKAYKTERLMLNFLNKQKSDLLLGNREKMWNKMEPELSVLRNDVFEMQILKLFDFTVWLESKLTQQPLKDILVNRKDSDGVKK